MALSATRQESTTVDELAHLTAGQALWAKGDYRLQPENGLLPQFWEGLPAFLEGRRLPPPGHPGWTQPNVWSLGQAYFHELGNDLGAMLFDGRAMNEVWSVATGLLIFLWARALFGAAGAWVSLGFFTFSPTFLANGALATSDMCMAFFMLASLGAYWRHLRHPTAANGAGSAVVFGLAFVAKFSAVLLLPMCALLALVRLTDGRPLAWNGRPAVRTRLGRAALLLGSAAVHAAAAWLIIWAFHRFRYEPAPNASLVNDYTRPWAEVLATIGSPFRQLVSWARHIRLLPDAYLYGFAFVVDLSHQRGAFLNGATSTTGWVQFFPYAFLVKTPLATLAAFAAALGIGVARWLRAGRRALAADAYRLAPLLVLFAVYWAFSITSHLNIGQRHLLPTYPVVFIALGTLGWQAARRWSRGWVAAIGLLLAAQVVASVSVRPHYLAFFNRLAGGPAEGYRHLVDSSLDWGQDLPGLAAWLDAHGLNRPGAPVYLAYFGDGDPGYYGIQATPMVPLLRIPRHAPWYRLHGGVYCISATLLSQAYSPIRGPWSAHREKEYQELRRVEPALLMYARQPQQRAALDRQVPAKKWTAMWQRFEQLRFTRLCAYLRARKPDAQIGYSINIYQVTEPQIDAVIRGNIDTWRAAIERALATRRER